MARYWIGDLHLGHKKVAEIRFPDLQGDEAIGTHDGTIMEQLLKLGPDDQVWVLGDISSGKPEDEDRALNLLRGLAPKFHLIAGNHDSVSGIHRNGYKQQRRWLQVFESVQDYTRVKLHGRNVQMHHYPRARSGDGPMRDGTGRYMEWRLPDTGMGLIHAHTHQETPHMELYGSWEDQVLQPGESKALDTQQYCVSWDTKRGLTTEQELTEWAKGLPK